MDKLGAWEGDSLGNDLDLYEGVAYYASVDDLTRFSHGIAKLIRRRLAKEPQEIEICCPAIFIMGPMPNYQSQKAKRVPRLNSGLSQISGFVWFMSCEANSGNGYTAQFGCDDELFNFIEVDLKSGDKPTIIFDAEENRRMFRLYPNGLQEADNCVQHPIDANDVSPEFIKNIIDQIHQNRLVTPEAGAGTINLWTNKDKHHPIEEPEAMIQAHLLTGLVAALTPCRVRPERTGVSGRCDIVIEEQDPVYSASWIQHAILELKVIKSFTSTGKAHPNSSNMSWLKSGMEQAYSYQQEHSAKFSALCCFDMQKKDDGDSCFDHIRKDAATLLVELWRWYVYATSKQYRAATAGKYLNRKK